MPSGVPGTSGAGTDGALDVDVEGLSARRALLGSIGGSWGVVASSGAFSRRCRDDAGLRAGRLRVSSPGEQNSASREPAGRT
ncbi:MULTISPECIES: hypothetical protein [Pseudonocardia]|uniref:hypothetical protein n=1 Tax=Pseudonocardia TaxID=1847 RepID=UPI000303A392|nr:hypothetical protein [Pseudonocardia dioxanivorans]